MPGPGQRQSPGKGGESSVIPTQPTVLVRERLSPLVRIAERGHLTPVWGAQRSQNFGERVEACLWDRPCHGAMP